MAGIRIGGRAVITDDPVVYVKTFSGESYAQIWTAGINGITAPAEVTSNVDDWAMLPRMSPNGQQVVYLYSNFSSGDEELRVINLDGSGETTLDDGSSGNCAACMWHPDGSVILYRIGDDAYTIEPDGSNKTLLYAPASGGVRRPTYSRDGTQIAFILLRTGNEQLWVMDSDGTNDAMVADMLGTSSIQLVGISWKHDDTIVAYQVNTVQSNVWTVEPDGSNNTQRSQGASPLDRPAMGWQGWAPDDSLLYVNRGGGTPFGLWSVDPVGSPGSSETDLSVATAGGNGAFPLVYYGRILVARDDNAMISLDLAGGDEIVLDDSGPCHVQFESGL